MKACLHLLSERRGASFSFHPRRVILQKVFFARIQLQTLQPKSAKYTTSTRKMRVGCTHAMELWFTASVVGAVLAGISNFAFKLVAVRGYDSELFSLVGGVASVVFVTSVLAVYPQPLMLSSGLALIVFATGCTAAVGGILKVYALRHIDSTIYFPLFKLLSPLLAIIAGVVWFGESFTWYEWIGMAHAVCICDRRHIGCCANHPLHVHPHPDCFGYRLLQRALEPAKGPGDRLVSRVVGVVGVTLEYEKTSLLHPWR